MSSVTQEKFEMVQNVRHSPRSATARHGTQSVRSSGSMYAGTCGGLVGAAATAPWDSAASHQTIWRRVTGPVRPRDPSGPGPAEPLCLVFVCFVAVVLAGCCAACCAAFVASAVVAILMPGIFLENLWLQAKTIKGAIGSCWSAVRSVAELNEGG